MKILAVVVLLLLLVSTASANCDYFRPTATFANCYWGGGVKWCYYRAFYYNYQYASPYRPETHWYQDPLYGETVATPYGPWTVRLDMPSEKYWENTGWTSRPNDDVGGPITFQFKYYCPFDQVWHTTLISTPAGKVFNWCSSIIGGCPTGLP